MSSLEDLFCSDESELFHYEGNDLALQVYFSLIFAREDQKLIPSLITTKEINGESLLKEVQQQNFKMVRQVFHLTSVKNPQEPIKYIFLNEDERVVFALNKTDSDNELKFFCRLCCENSEAEKWKNFLQKYIVEKNYSSFNFLSKKSYGLGLQSVQLKNTNIDLEKNYGVDLKNKHDKFLSHLKQKNTNGLFLFHGKPGTGKTTYIKHLCCLTNKKTIFVPNGLTSYIDDPDFVQLLFKHRNCIILIEDAEKCIETRDENSSNLSISTILNLTDGILGEALGANVIITFNTDRDNIDNALLRKGRLKGEHSFDLLSIEKAKDLACFLGLEDKIEINNPMSLADIYAYKDQKTDLLKEEEEKRSMGFKT